MSISKLGQRRQIVIPKDICDDIGIEIGDFLEVSLSAEHKIIITPKKLVDLEDTLTPDEEKSVARGFKDIEEGNFISLSELKNELGM